MSILPSAENRKPFAGRPCLEDSFLISCPVAASQRQISLSSYEPVANTRESGEKARQKLCLGPRTPTSCPRVKSQRQRRSFLSSTTRCLSEGEKSTGQFNL